MRSLVALIGLALFSLSAAEPNGLRVVLSPDATAPTVVTAVYYRSYLSTYVQKVRDVKPSDIQRVSESYLVPSKMTIVVVGDKSKIADQLKPYE